MSSSSPRRDLHALARLSGLQTAYFNVKRERVNAPDDTLYALLNSMGIPVDCAAGCREFIHQRERQHWERMVEPVIVAWDGHMPRFEVRANARETLIPHVEIIRQDGTYTKFHSWDIHIDDDPGKRVNGVDYRRLRVNTGETLPTGYHTLHVALGGREASALIIAAPRRCYSDDSAQPRKWGVFAPLYAMRGPSDWGAGSYGDLSALGTWVRELGGAFTGTLPLLPFEIDGSNPSPYLPFTRLFWSDFYVDIEAIPFVGECPSAVELMQDRAFIAGRNETARASLVQYAEVHRMKSAVLSALWQHFADGDNPVSTALRSYVEEHPRVSDYARFRAEAEEGRESTLASSRASGEQIGDSVRFYEFVQWLTEEQVQQCSERAADLYLDLPIGIHPEGYDANRFAECFLNKATCGAPPDVVFTTGQDWGAPPLHTAAIRERGYDYLRECIAHHMRASRILRLDHIMGFHRMFCIPQGGSPSEGTYLRYRSEEMYALLSVESHRYATTVVGENLGTVPHEVPRAMMRHNVDRMFVFYYEMDGLERGLVPHVPRGAMASLNTHDMPTFASTWDGFDIRQQADLGVIASNDVAGALQRREKMRRGLLDLLRLPRNDGSGDQTHLVLSALLKWMGRSPARFAMVNLEDLWLETRHPNVPGVGARYPSWQYRMSYTLREMMNDGDVVHDLQEVASARLPARKRRSLHR